jgi:hypothetical protein
MLPVLDLHPVSRPAALVWPVAVLGAQTLQPHIACGTEKIGTDLALLEGIHEDALRPTRQEAFEAVLAELQGQPAEIIITVDEDVEGAVLDLVVVLATVEGVEVGDAIHA